MKFTSILASAFAAVAVAAPAENQKRGGGFNLDLNNVNNLGFDLNSVNGLNFGNDIFQYLFNLNSQNFLLSPILELAVGNNFNFGNQFGDLFNSNFGNNVNIEDLLRFQELATFASIAGTGVLQGFNLQDLVLSNLQLGALGNSFGSFDVNSLLDSSALSLIAPVLAQQVIVL